MNDLIPKRNPSKQIICTCIATVIFMPWLSFASETDLDQKEIATIQNDVVKITYHLDAGTYDLIDLSSGRTLISAAHSEIEKWSSTDVNLVRSAEILTDNNELGVAKRLLVKCSGSNSPTLITELDVQGRTNSLLHCDSV